MYLTRLDKIAIFLLALFQFIGRWNIDRIVLNPLPLWLEPRAVISLLLILLVWLKPKVSQARIYYYVERKIPVPILILVLFLGYMILASLWAPENKLSFIKAYELSLLLVVCISTYLLLIRNDSLEVNNHFWRYFSWFSLTIAGIAIFNWGSLDVDSPSRVSVLGGGPNVFGRNMGLLVLISLSAISISKANKLWSIVSIIAVALVILSGSRGAFIATVIGVLTYSFLCFRNKRKLHTVVVGTTISAMLMLFLSWTPIGVMVTETFHNRIGDLLLEQHYTSGRDVLFLDAFYLGMENLFIGAGLAAFGSYGYGGYPHNLFLEVFCEGGALGVLLLLITLMFALKVVFSQAASANVITCSAFPFVLTAAQFSGDLYDNRAVFIIILMLIVPGRIEQTHKVQSPLLSLTLSPLKKLP